MLRILLFAAAAAFTTASHHPHDALALPVEHLGARLCTALHALEAGDLLADLTRSLKAHTLHAPTNTVDKLRSLFRPLTTERTLLQRVVSGYDAAVSRLSASIGGETPSVAEHAAVTTALADASAVLSKAVAALTPKPGAGVHPGGDATTAEYVIAHALAATLDARDAVAASLARLSDGARERLSTTRTAFDEATAEVWGALAEVPSSEASLLHRLNRFDAHANPLHGMAPAATREAAPAPPPPSHLEAMEAAVEDALRRFKAAATTEMANASTTVSTAATNTLAKLWTTVPTFLQRAAPPSLHQEVEQLRGVLRRATKLAQSQLMQAKALLGGLARTAASIGEEPNVAHVESVVVVEVIQPGDLPEAAARLYTAGQDLLSAMGAGTSAGLIGGLRAALLTAENTLTTAVDVGVTLEYGARDDGTWAAVQTASRTALQHVDAQLEEVLTKGEPTRKVYALVNAVRAASSDVTAALTRGPSACLPAAWHGHPAMK